MEIVNGKEVKTKLLEDLIQATKENIEATTEQNNKMVYYTKWLFGLTITIGVFTLLQLLIAFYKFIVL